MPFDTCFKLRIQKPEPFPNSSNLISHKSWNMVPLIQKKSKSAKMKPNRRSEIMSRCNQSATQSKWNGCHFTWKLFNMRRYTQLQGPRYQQNHGTLTLLLRALFACANSPHVNIWTKNLNQSAWKSGAECRYATISGIRIVYSYTMTKLCSAKQTLYQQSDQCNLVKVNLGKLFGTLYLLYEKIWVRWISFVRWSIWRIRGGNRQDLNSSPYLLGNYLRSNKITPRWSW